MWVSVSKKAFFRIVNNKLNKNINANKILKNKTCPLPYSPNALNGNVANPQIKYADTPAKKYGWVFWDVFFIL
jgi:hypothetical protein